MQDLSIHTFVNPRSNLAFFRISMRFGVKLSILLNRTLSVSFYWKNPLRLYLLRFTIIGLDLFWSAFFSPILCVQSRSTDVISKFIFVVIVSIISLIRPSIHHHQFQLSHESRDCLARILLMLIYCFSRFSIFLLITDTFSLVTQVLDYLFSFFSFFLILVKFCAYKVNCFIQIF